MAWLLSAVLKRTSLVLALLALLTLVPETSAWTSRTHGRMATNAFDALPDYYKKNLDDSMLYSASLAPDDWREDGGPVQQFGTPENSSSAPGHPASAAFDGDPSTYWQANVAGSDQWIGIDLGIPYRIVKVRFLGVENRPDVRVQYSHDGVAWETYATGYNVWHDEDVTPDYYYYRYWRLYFTGVPEGTYAKVNEIEIFATGDNAHRATYCRERAAYWLRRARDNLLDNNYDSALYNMGIAAHYIGDAMTLVHNDNIWNNNPPFQGENSQWVEEHPSGWNRHKHFEEQVRYHEPATPSPRNWRATLDDYIENYLYPYLDNYWSNHESDWFSWLSTRNADYSKSAIDNATQLVYDAWYSLLYEIRGAPPAGMGLTASGEETQSSTILFESNQETQLPPLILFSLALVMSIPALRNEYQRKRKLRKEERGITPAVGAFLVIALLTVASFVLITTWIPQLERRNEADHLDSVRDAWHELQRVILAHENRTIEVELNPKSASVFGIFGQRMNPGRIEITPAKFVKRIAPIADAYVGETGSSGTNNLWAQSHFDNDRRVFIRFDLSSLESDASIREARLMVYAEISKFLHTLTAPGYGTGYSSVPALLEVREVNDDTWTETITWATQPSYGDAIVNGDWPYENRWEIPYDAMWYTFNLTQYIQEQRDIDNLVSLAIKAVREDSILQRYARFRSRESSHNRPHLLIVYERASGVGEPVIDEWGTIADGGSVVFETEYKHYGTYTLAFESGGLIMERYYTYTLMISNPDLIVALHTDDDENLRIYVNRYRITNQAGLGGKGKVMLKVTVTKSSENVYHLENPSVAVRTDYPRAWRGDHPLVRGGYFTDLAARFEGRWGSLDYMLEAWDSDGDDLVVRDFYLIALTIQGRHLGPRRSGSANVCSIENDVILVERVFDVRIDATLA